MNKNNNNDNPKLIDNDTANPAGIYVPTAYGVVEVVALAVVAANYLGLANTIVLANTSVVVNANGTSTNYTK